MPVNTLKQIAQEQKSFSWLSINSAGAVRLRFVGDAEHMEPTAATTINFRQ